MAKSHTIKRKKSNIVENKIELENLPLSINKDHPIYLVDDSGTISSKPFMFDPEQLTFEIQELESHSCMFNIFYTSKEQIRFTIKRNNEERKSVKLKNRDLLFFLNKGKGLVYHLSLDEKKNEEICNSKFKIQGVKEFLDKKFVLNGIFDDNNNILNKVFRIDLKFFTFTFEGLNLKKLKSELILSEGPMTNKVAEIFKEEMDRNIGISNNEKEVEEGKSLIKSKSEEWLKNLKFFCDKNKLYEGKTLIQIN